MIRSIDDVPFPKRRKQPKGSSGKGNKHTVGLSIALLALPVSGIAYAVGFIVHGHFFP